MDLEVVLWDRSSQTQLEEYYSSKAENMLAAVLGPNRASVQVAATINRVTVTTESTTYDKDKVTQREETTTARTYREVMIKQFHLLKPAQRVYS